MFQCESRNHSESLATDRRSFLKSAGTLGMGAATVLTGVQVFGEASPSQQIVLGIVGCGGR
ncbi:MAG TPA: twin-arginine translocation signal domain-containing protein, partial [Thermogutta sp.]|nr:twin-arginine translocation signal domain-containing protein [Thermogutta sp.]